jgi:hypothetical protein
MIEIYFVSMSVLPLAVEYRKCFEDRIWYLSNNGMIYGNGYDAPSFQWQVECI